MSDVSETIERTAERDYIAGLGKGLAVIECFDEQHGRLTIAQVAEMTRLSRAAARRCLLTLQRLGYAEFDGKFFSLTPRVLRLGYAYLASSELPQLIQPFLEKVSEATDESCSASILDGNEILYIARSARKRIMTVDLGVGTRLPAYCTSMGRVLLAALDPAEATARLQASERRAVTPYTRTRIEEIMATLSAAREQGFCVIDQELEVGLVSIAVPLVDSTGRTVAAMNVGAQVGRVSAVELPGRFLARLNEAKAHLRPLIKRAHARLR